jgi:hypothetical protein
MGKNKRNKRNRDREVAMSSLERFLRIPETPPISELGQATVAVRPAEAALLKARRRAAIAAHESRDRGLGPDYQRARKRVLDRAAEPCTVPGDPVSLETTEPGEDLASAFFNRAGDYFLAKFTITTDPDADASIAPTATAETVLKADEAQFPYLLEVLRQIRGGFGTRCRVELYRTHTVEQGPAADHEPPPPGRVVITEENLEEAAASIGLTGEELVKLSPGEVVRHLAEAAAELGKRADELGGNIYSTGDLEVDQIARELGIPVESLQKIPMAGGGYAYSVIPTPPPEPEGRHSAPDPEPEVDWSQLAANAWQGAGQYRMPANRGPGYTHLCRTIDELELELRANGVPAPGAWLVARSR